MIRHDELNILKNSATQGNFDEKRLKNYSVEELKVLLKMLNEELKAKRESVKHTTEHKERLEKWIASLERNANLVDKCIQDKQKLGQTAAYEPTLTMPNLSATPSKSSVLSARAIMEEIDQKELDALDNASLIELEGKLTKDLRFQKGNIHADAKKWAEKLEANLNKVTDLLERRTPSTPLFSGAPAVTPVVQPRARTFTQNHDHSQDRLPVMQQSGIKIQHILDDKVIKNKAYNIDNVKKTDNHAIITFNNHTKAHIAEKDNGINYAVDPKFFDKHEIRNTIQTLCTFAVDRVMTVTEFKIDPGNPHADETRQYLVEAIKNRYEDFKSKGIPLPTVIDAQGQKLSPEQLKPKTEKKMDLK